MFTLAAVKCRFSRSGTFWSEGFGDRGADLPPEPDPGQAVLSHHACDALVVDPILDIDAVVELCGHPRRTVGLVTALGRVLDRTDPVRELIVCGSAFGSRRRSVLPGVERGPVDLDDLTQPLHLEGVSVVGNELEAAHQFVSPAKYFAA